MTPIAVGSSADIAYAAEIGTPSIDGFGIRGGGAHGVDDYADLSSIVPRVYLLTRMLMDLGRNPAVHCREIPWDAPMKCIAGCLLDSLRRPVG